jgi:hypothetical protein
MHERTDLADELTAEDLAELDTMEDTLTWYDLDPSDIELARRDAMIERGYLNLAALIAGVTVGLLALAFGLALFARDVQAQDTTLTAPGQINGRVYEWPAIGNDLYTRSCEIVRWWEDGSAIASCWEDGAAYTFDPEENTWTPVSESR